MTKSILILAVSGLLAAQSATQTWSGSLIDDSCRSADAAAKCEVSDTTKAFGVVTAEGKYFKLDIGGNTKAHEALATQQKSGAVEVTVDGLLDGETIKVGKLQIR
jgi:hypothetical protein